MTLNLQSAIALGLGPRRAMPAIFRQDRGGRRFIYRISRTASNSRGSGVRVNYAGLDRNQRCPIGTSESCYLQSGPVQDLPVGQQSLDRSQCR